MDIDTKLNKITALDCKGFNSIGTIQTDIQSVSKIDKGVEVFAKGWLNGTQVGFGDGTVEIERFRIFNPPILVDDPKGTITISTTDSKTNLTTVRTLREDPVAALQQVVAHLVKTTGRKGNIIKGKVGNTTDTYYSDSNGNGYTGRSTAGESWASLRGGTGNESGSGVDNYSGYNQTNAGLTLWVELIRGLFPFDTSALPDTDTITSATFSVYGKTKQDFLSQSVCAVLGVQASNTAVANSDFQSNAGVSQASSTNITITSWLIEAYNDFPLNATGLAAISKTGFTNLGIQLTGDNTNTEPSKSSATAASVYNYLSGTAGTTKDPMLVVVHSAPVSADLVSVANPFIAQLVIH